MKNLFRICRYVWNSAVTFISRILNIKSMPEYLFWEVDDCCNSRCLQCNIWKRKPAKDILTSEEVGKIFGSGFFKNVREVIISGGEPFLLPELEKNLLIMQKHISPKAVVSLSTNGLLPDRVIKITRKCVESGMNIVVGVSLDGVGAHHDLMRGVEGNFNKVDFLLHELLKMRLQYKKNLKVIVGYTLSSQTMNNMKEVRDYVEGLGLNFAPQMYEEFTFYDLTDEVKKSYGEFSVDMVKSRGKMQEAVKTLPATFQKEVLLTCLKQGAIYFNCASMRKFFVLHSNGDVSPCLRYAHVRLGNIRSGKLKEWWTGPEAEKGRQIVDKCPGCSNTWGTFWSMEHWFPPFLPLIIQVFKEKIFLKRKKGK